MRLVPTRDAARLLGLHFETLRRLTMDDWVELKIGRLRVYRIDPGPYGERRFDADEIIRLQRRASQKEL